MKKILIVLAVVLLASPALARTDITMAKGATWNEVVVSYNCSTEPNRVRAFALNVALNNGAKIATTPAPGSFHAKYWVYPGSIDINATTGVVHGKGSAVANAAIYTQDTLGGPGTTGMTVEMGSLYTATDGNQPATSGQLFKFTVDKGCTVTITPNVIRGGVVLENPAVAADVNAPAYSIVAFNPAHADYAYFMDPNVGQPTCFAYLRQCFGDADGKPQGGRITGWWYVGTDDMTVLLGSWQVLENCAQLWGPNNTVKCKKPSPPFPPNTPTPSGSGVGTYSSPNVTVTVAGEAIPAICADFERDLQGGSITGYWRVGTADMTLLLNNWQVLEPATGWTKPTPPFPPGQPTPSGAGLSKTTCGGYIEKLAVPTP
jgi:hypothetical protein